MDSERDRYFSPEDADQWGMWSEELEPKGEEELDAYMTALCEYYGNRVTR